LQRRPFVDVRSAVRADPEVLVPGERCQAPTAPAGIANASPDVPIVATLFERRREEASATLGAPVGRAGTLNRVDKVPGFQHALVRTRSYNETRRPAITGVLSSSSALRFPLSMRRDRVESSKMAV